MTTAVSTSTHKQIDAGLAMDAAVAPDRTPALHGESVATPTTSPLSTSVLSSMGGQQPDFASSDSETEVLEGQGAVSDHHSTRVPAHASQTVASAHFEAFKSSVRVNKICCIGAGYVGGPTMAVIADKCPDINVYVADISEERIAQWNSNTLPIYEPGLHELVQKRRGLNLHFTTDVKGCVEDCDIIFVAVNTPTKLFGVGKGRAADMSAWELASRAIAQYARSNKVIIEKSTVPVRTAASLKRVLRSNALSDTLQFAILSNPEFLAEGTAIPDLLHPDRVLIGGEEKSAVGQYAISLLADIYGRWVPREKIVTTNLWSSELSKLVGNAFLAQRVSSINSVAMLAEKCGADVRQISAAVGADTRIGRRFLSASVGFGGSCLEKDTLSLAYLCEFYGLREASMYWLAVVEMNDIQKRRFTQRILHGLFDTVNRKQLAIFGFAFKKDTGDVRSTPAISVCRTLMADGAILRCFDPKADAGEVMRELSGGGTFPVAAKQFTMVDQPIQAIADAHAIIILTEWDCFKEYDYRQFFEVMKKPAFIFDGRNLLDHVTLREIGFEVRGVGVPA